MVADFEEELARLEAAYDLLTRAADPSAAHRRRRSGRRGPAPGVVVGRRRSWCGRPGPDTAPASNDELADRLEAIGGPALGWSLHPAVPLPAAARAAALSIPVEESLGWLVAVGGGLATATGVGRQRRVARPGRRGGRAPRRPGRGRARPCGHQAAPQGRSLDLGVRWVPALVDDAELERLAAAMPGPVTALRRGRRPRPSPSTCSARSSTPSSREAAGQLELPAPPPTTRTAAGGRRGVHHPPRRLDVRGAGRPPAPRCRSGSTAGPSRSPAPAGRGSSCSSTRPTRGDAWFLSVLGPGAEGAPAARSSVALGDSKATKPLADELARLERLLPALLRARARCAAARCT